MMLLTSAHLNKDWFSSEPLLMKVRFSAPPRPLAFETKVGSKARRAEIDQILKEYIPKNERR